MQAWEVKVAADEAKWKLNTIFLAWSNLVPPTATIQRCRGRENPKTVQRNYISPNERMILYKFSIVTKRKWKCPANPGRSSLRVSPGSNVVRFRFQFGSAVAGRCARLEPPQFSNDGDNSCNYHCHQYLHQRHRRSRSVLCGCVCVYFFMFYCP